MDQQNLKIEGDYSYPNVYFLGTEAEIIKARETQERIRMQWKKILESPAFCCLKFRTQWGTDVVVSKDRYNSGWKMINFGLDDKPSAERLYGRTSDEESDILEALLRYSSRRDVDITLTERSQDVTLSLKHQHAEFMKRCCQVVRERNRENIDR